MAVNASCFFFPMRSRMAVTRGQSGSFAVSCIARSVSDRVIADFNSLFVFFKPFIVSIAVFNKVAPHPQINDVRCPMFDEYPLLKRNSNSNPARRTICFYLNFRCLGHDNDDRLRA